MAQATSIVNRDLGPSSHHIITNTDMGYAMASHTDLRLMQRQRLRLTLRLTLKLKLKLTLKLKLNPTPSQAHPQA